MTEIGAEKNVVSGSEGAQISISLKLLLGCIACYFVAGASTWLHPLIVHDLTDVVGISPREAGNIVAVEMAAMTVFALVVARKIDRLNLRTAALIGIVVTIIGHLASATYSGDGVLAFGAARLVAGAGEGVMLGLPAAALAGTRNADRNYAMMTGTALLLGATLIALAPRFVFMSDSTSGFWALLAAAAVALPLIFFMPSGFGAARAKASMAGKDAAKVAALIAAVLLFGSPAVVVWVNIRLIGSQTTASADTLPLLISFAVFLSLAGAIAAGLIGVRFGRKVPMIGVLLFQGAGVFVLCHTTDGFVFAVCAAIEKAGAFFLLPYFLGAAAMLDRRGGYAAAVSTAWMLCGVTGPLIGGYIFELGGASALGWTAFVANCIACLLLLLVLGRNNAVEQPG